MIYFQEYKYVEDGYGETNVTFVIANNFDGVMDATLETATEVGIFELAEIGEKIGNGVGGIIEQNMSFEINGANVKTSQEIEALNFVNDCLNPETQRYCAIFLNRVIPYTNPADDEIRFIGMLDSKIDTDDLQWYSEQYADNITSLKSYKYNSKPVQEVVFDIISLKDLIYGNSENPNEIVPGLDTTWETANVIDRTGWYKYSYLSIPYEVRVCNLFDLNVLLRKLADNLVEALANKGFGTYIINFDSCTLDGRWMPTRYRHILNHGYNSRFVDATFVNQSNSGQPSYSYPYNFDDTGSYYSPILKINPDAVDKTSETYKEETIWLDYKNIKKKFYNNTVINDTEPSSSLVTDYLWEKKETFLGLINAIAMNFGIYVKLYYTGTNEINIRFKNRSSYGDNLSNRIYIKDAMKNSQKISAIIIDKKENTKFVGDSFYYAEEGRQIYYKILMGSTDENKDFDYKAAYHHEGGNKLLLTIGPTLAKLMGNVSWLKPKDTGGNPVMASLPHNIQCYRDGNPTEKRWDLITQGLHTGIYMYVRNRPDWYFSLEPANYWTPAGAVNIQFGDEEIVFTKLSDYLNKIGAIDNSSFESELSMDVPFWNGFSDGVTNHVKHLQLGKIVKEDELYYSISSYKIDLKNLNTSMTLSSNGRFDIKSPLTIGTLAEQTVEHEVPRIFLGENTAKKEAAEDITASGLLLSLKSDNKVEISAPNDTHFGRLYGFSIGTVDMGGDAFIQTDGNVFNPLLPFVGACDSGETVYLKTVQNDVNVTKVVPTIGYNKLIAKVGIINGDNSFKIDFSRQLISKESPT